METGYQDTISGLLRKRGELLASMTQATQKAIAEEPRVGLVALLAGFSTRSDGPVRVHTTGMGGNYGDRESFASR